MTAKLTEFGTTLSYLTPGILCLLESAGVPLEQIDLLKHDTPIRFIKAYEEMLRGYNTDAESIVKVVDHVRQDQLVLIKDINFTSVCAHHLLPFSGTVSVGYVPGKSKAVCGLSKIPRLVETLACRLQLQEHLAEQISENIQNALNPRGVGVTIKATHSCMSCRGVRQNAETITVIRNGCIYAEEVWFSEYSRRTG